MIEDAFVSYVIFVLLIAGAVDSWISGRFEFWIIVVSALLAITGYLGHEFIHKYMALRYGTRMEFRSSLLGGIITIISSAFGVSVAPVALAHLHDEALNKKQRMLVSLSGTLVNLMLALFFLGFSLVFTFWQPYFIFGISLNLAMAVAALLPVGFLEGRRIWEYSKVLCLGLLFITIALEVFMGII